MELIQDDWQEILKNLDFRSDFDYGSEPVILRFFTSLKGLLDSRTIQRNTSGIFGLFENQNSCGIIAMRNSLC